MTWWQGGGGEGVWIPPKSDDVIYEQPLTQVAYFANFCTLYCTESQGVNTRVCDPASKELSTTILCPWFPHQLHPRRFTFTKTSWNPRLDCVKWMTFLRNGKDRQKRTGCGVLTRNTISEHQILIIPSWGGSPPLIPVIRSALNYVLCPHQ